MCNCHGEAGRIPGGSWILIYGAQQELLLFKLIKQSSKALANLFVLPIQNNMLYVSVILDAIYFLANLQLFAYNILSLNNVFIEIINFFSQILQTFLDHQPQLDENY